MTEKSDNVTSLAEFRTKNPTPTGKLIRDPNSKSRISKEKSSTESKMLDALAKYGSLTGNQHKKKKTEESK